MPNNLPLPPDLQHLIEKRSGDERRQTDADGAANTAEESAPANDPEAERRRRIRREEDR